MGHHLVVNIYLHVALSACRHTSNMYMLYVTVEFGTWRSRTWTFPCLVKEERMRCGG